MRPQFTDYAVLVFLAAIWGGSFQFIKLALDSLDPWTIAAARTVIAAAILYAFMRYRGQSLPPWGPVWGRLMIIAASGVTLPFFLIGWGERRIDSALAAVLMAFVPLTTTLLAHFATDDEKLTPAKIFGLGLGFAGIVILSGILDDGSSAGRVSAGHLGQAAVLAGAVGYAVSNIVARRLRGLGPLQTATGVILCAAILATPLAALVEQPWRQLPSMISVMATAMLGFFSTATGALMMYWLLKRTGATFVSLNSYLVPVFGAIFGIVLLGEAFTASMPWGLGLILLGVRFSSRAPGSAKALFSPRFSPKAGPRKPDNP